MVILIWLVMSLSVWAVESIDSEITRITSALKGEYTLGKPVIIGELTIIPVVKPMSCLLAATKLFLFK